MHCSIYWAKFALYRFDQRTHLESCRIHRGRGCLLWASHRLTHGSGLSHSWEEEDEEEAQRDYQQQLRLHFVCSAI